MGSMRALLPDTECVDFNRQRVKQEAMMGIFMLMEEQRLSKSDLADLLGGKKKRPLVTKFLSGTHNFCLDTLADIYAVLGSDLHFRITAGGGRFALPVDDRYSAQCIGHTSVETDAIALFDKDGTTESGVLQYGKEDSKDPTRFKFSSGNTRSA